MDDDLDTPNAINSLLVLVKAVNRYAAEERLDKRIVDAVSKPLNDMLFILGLKRVDVSMEERLEIEHLISKRNELRALKRYREADEIRDTLRARGIELIDHKNKTVWKKLS
jgi:cysteinyl-tRNA synthetase